MREINVFISQPMRNRTEAEILKERESIMEYVRKLYQLSPNVECKEIKSYFPASIDSKNEPLKMLGMSIEMLAEADIAVFAEGWVCARGCKIEYECASQYGIRVIDLD